MSLITRQPRILVLFALATAPLVCAQPPQTPDLRLVSEFQRYGPDGNPLPQDRDFAPREIISPAIARNGHLSVHIVVTGPSGTNYFIYAGANPPGYVQFRLYREWFVPCGASLLSRQRIEKKICPDWITEQRSGSFGAIPESRTDMPEQTARVYLLDIWAPPTAPVGRVRVEAQLRAGTVFVAPMEVRVIDQIIPTPPQRDAVYEFAENIAPLEAASSATADAQVLRYRAGLPPQLPPALLRVRDIIQRNAAEDMALAHSREFDPWDLRALSTFPFARPDMGPEWYLRVRDFIYRSYPHDSPAP